MVLDRLIENPFKIKYNKITLKPAEGFIIFGISVIMMYYDFLDKLAEI